MSIMEIFETMEYGPAPEASSLALAWMKEHQPFQLFINNQWVKPANETYFESRNPATGKALTQIAAADKADVDKAVAAARKAFTSWSKTPGHVRARYLYAIARHIQKHGRLLAVLEALDNGKTIRETRDIDIPLVARHFYYHAGWAQLMEAELPDYQPVGVVGQIIPWNFPLLMLGLEDRARPGHGQYRCPEACPLYLADRVEVCRDYAGSGPARRGCQHRYR
ncbi:hypothetical protein KDK_44810 [Dictyobacter kobayashii]|uniref:Aldehyde dehydrogenase domain-containing protein n=1 Tax=Dictyobacter kobayashii TaxID=2014872 RepID=A0A402ANB1_9CHLR|nr:aldehyde dehydrogenase family protein [Dictyobacter kobayashii]GCE20681.1 hypothetical protein KDK_44810 [Dictyobacter kobayashii]